MTYQIRQETHDGMLIYHLEGPGGLPSLSMIPAEGAAIYSWRVPGPTGSPVDLIFPCDLEKVRGLRDARFLFGFPYLFPFANRVYQDNEQGAYAWEGKRYPMTIHGFSTYLPWTVVSMKADTDSATIVISLEDSPATMEMYPWKFRVELTYRLTKDDLVIDHTVSNRSDRPMPLSPGWHPYFHVPIVAEGKQTECIVHLPGTTELGINMTTAQMTGGSKPFAQQDMTLGEHGATGKYVTDLDSPHTSVFDPAARMGVEMDLRDKQGKIAWPYILTWTLSDDSSFFCVEPYEGVTDAVHNKIGLRILEAGESYETRLKSSVIRKS